MTALIFMRANGSLWTRRGATACAAQLGVASQAEGGRAVTLAKPSPPLTKLAAWNTRAHCGGDERWSGAAGYRGRQCTLESAGMRSMKHSIADEQKVGRYCWYSAGKICTRKTRRKQP